MYQADKVFTPTESRRWSEIWQRYGRSISGDAQYGRLCYDTGILYLCYYDYMGLKDVQANVAEGIVVASGQGAIQNASRSTDWFARAKRAAAGDPSGHAGLQVDENVDELAALDVYETIGEFYEQFTTAGFEGRDVSAASASFWQSLSAAILGDADNPPVVLQSSKIVQLRLYQVAFESINSSTYLTGFRQAGVTADEVTTLLEALRDRLTAEEFRSYVESNPAATQAMYDEVVNGYEDAVANINRTYNSPTSRVRGSAEGGE